ncbi:MAG: GxxExxY protein [Opitutus sp.]|nr:GxxExxY protein [Opitutus sp.]
MPIESPILLPRLSTEEFWELDHRVMAHAFASHRDLGRLCDESIYQADLAARLTADGLGPVHCEFPLTVSFRGFVHRYYADLVVADRALYELKTETTLVPAYDAQLLNYLLLANAARGKLVNFRPPSVESRFVNAPLPTAERHRFVITCDHPNPFFTLVAELVTDLGTGLERALYGRALTHLLGGENEVVRLLPMNRGSTPLGNQRFHLAAPDTAFILTSLSSPESSHHAHLQRLLQASPLTRLLWVNIALHDLSFTTITRTPSP